MVNIRSKGEIDRIGKSGRVVFDTLNLLENYIVPGSTGEELNRLAEEYIRSQGYVPAFNGYMGYPATLCVSINDAVVHGIPDRRQFRDGDIVSIDCGVVKDGYYGDSARTFAVGEVSEEVEKLLDVTEKSLYRGIEKAVVGNHVSDIGHSIQEYVEEFGFSIVRELVGHGIGTELHEEPQIPNFGEPGRGTILKEGMCLAIEPMVNLGLKEIYTKPDGWTICTKDGKPSAHFEHTVVVTSDEARILSNGTLDG
ncbi:MAG: type I methionyl aminopeptidase [Candidatus Neomarinimicrobiota bacterium]